MPVDFTREVLDRSQHVPVVVDFWAPWCGPCRVLGPVLDRLAAEAGGLWELVKIDTDEQAAVASEWEVRGIPAVKMFHRGELVASFVGALPASEVKRWLDTNLPDPRHDELVEIVGNWERRERAELRSALEAFHARHPDLDEGRLRLAQAVVLEDPARARQLLAALDGGSQAELASDVATLAELMELAPGASPELERTLTDARAALVARDWERALERLIAAVTLDRAFADELARRAAVALFRMLGHHHELTLEYQRRLAMALHV